MMQIDPTEIYKRLLEAGMEWADADEAARLLEKSRESVLAEVIQEAVAKEPSISQAAAKEIALASKRYRDFVHEMCAAKGAANRARVKYDAAESWFEALRTKAATLRQELRTMPHQT